jgi:glycosyltransferase involved in cell wall biosynthesis
VRWLDADVLGVVNTAPQSVDPSMLRDLRQLCPLISYTEPAARVAVNAADVVIVWGFGGIGPYMSETRAKVVFVNHCSGPMGTAPIQEIRKWNPAWAGVAEICRTSFPADLAPLMTVVHNGADIERTTPIHGRAATRAKWGLQDDQIAIGYIGRMSPEKRPTAVAEAVALLPGQYVAVLIGGGRDEAGTRAQCERIAPGRCKYVGHQPRSIGDALAAIDVWMNASPSEGFCLSLLEAQLARVPCVSTVVGVLPELRDTYGELAVEVPVGCDATTLGLAVLTAIQPTVQVIVDRAYQVARNHFTAPAMAFRWDAFLRQILTTGITGR